MATTQECCKQYWTSPGGSTPQSSSCTATYHPSRKLPKLDKPDMQGHCLRSRDKLISDVLLWTPSHPMRDEDLLEVMDNREGWWERVGDICADGATWWKCLPLITSTYLSLNQVLMMPLPYQLFIQCGPQLNSWGRGWNHSYRVIALPEG